nr:PREDICTED: membrane-spanning 4-domains subfamily A member 15 isoform X3 [Anolis carolinensis]|eukprot:XP_016851048.1 PREDICTED: membrane-spanning 4-domains subfamily A member 15 isoform X3 [Anolis carolinensis]
MSSGPMESANGNIVIIAPNGAKTIQAGEQIPSTLMDYIRSGGQQNGSLSSQPQQKHCVGAFEKIIKLEAKTLGFIASGSLSVSAEKHWNTNLKNTSVAINILSAIMASLGIIWYIFDIAQIVRLPKQLISSSSHVSIHLAFVALFLILTSLEFCITVIVTHFGCRANCCTDDTAIVYVPCTINGENTIPTEKNVASQLAV